MSQIRWVVRGAVVMLAVFGSLILVGPGRGDASAMTARPAESHASRTAIAWRACGNRLQCARVRVPLDWSRARLRTGRGVFAGPTISLSVIRYRTSNRRRRIGSLFMNFGGPGVAGTQNVRAAGAAFDGLARGRFDIVSWDPRGTGASAHVRCFPDRRSMVRFWGPDWSIPTTPLESRRYVPKTVAYARRCEARSGRLLAHISTADTVRDLDYLRSLVGDRRLNYRGESYGTFLGQTYANMFPRRVGRMVLDALIDPVPFVRSVEAAIANNAADAGLVFNKFLSLCEQAGPARCALAGQGPVAPRARALLAQLRVGPIPAPSAPSGQLTYGETLIALWLTLGTPETWPKLASDLNQAAGGDGSELANTFVANKTLLQEALVPSTALQCADKPLPRRGAVNTWPRVIDRFGEQNGVVEAWWLWAPCASWRIASANRYTGPWNATTKNPILVIGNRYDPRTKYANAQVAARRLGNAVLLTNNGYGHTSSSDLSDCTIEAVGRYLTTLARPTRRVCQPNHRPFDPDFGE